MPRFMDSEVSVVDCHLGTEGMKLGTERGRRVPGTSVRNPSVMSSSFSILSYKRSVLRVYRRLPSRSK
jgi:hypothetical protein